MPNKISENIYEVKKEGKMRVHGIIFASEKLMKNIEKDGKTIEQIKNVAQLPGIVEKSIAMSDAHCGYGFPIGGVAAFDLEKGIVSPGGVGYDINCGVRLLATNLTKDQFLKNREKVLNEMYKEIPSGVGKETEFNLTKEELDEVLNTGVNWAVKKKYATSADLEHIEDFGCIKNADADKVSQKAKSRGKNQLGSLGSGNHFIEIQVVESVFNKDIAEVYNLKKDQVVIMIHSGSRGLGHQTASDYIQKIEKKFGFKHLPDRELAYAPLSDEIAKEYISAMNAAANFAFVNRQLMTYQIRKVFNANFKNSKIEIIYDICHNIAKFEKHLVDGKEVELCVHRKGATRSFGPGRKEIPSDYRKVGCPIFLPGSMGTFSYVLAGTKQAEKISFASTAHGAGRLLSRSYAINNLSEVSIKTELSKNDIMLKSGSRKGILEEAPEAYKDIDEVARVSHELGIGQLVARLKPMAVMKG
ncbi:MAG: RtcB family protein [Nanoarchaeota archaeon]